MRPSAPARPTTAAPEGREPPSARRANPACEGPAAAPQGPGWPFPWGPPRDKLQKNNLRGGSSMKHSAWLLLFAFAAGPQYASAQQAGVALNATQRHGQQLLAQSCGICHLPPVRGPKSFGPPLNNLA